MFHSRKKSVISLVCMDKATTFAPALREKHGTIYYLFIYYLLVEEWWKIKTNLFSKRLVSSEKSTTFAPALRVKLSTIYHSVISCLLVKSGGK
jgi:hypothetical protein